MNKKLNMPSAIVLFPGDSVYVAGFLSKIRDRFAFDETSMNLPGNIAGATTVKLTAGSVTSFDDPVVRQFVWQDPLEEQDLVLINCESRQVSPERSRDLLNFACPPNVHQVVTVVAQPNSEIDSGFRVSVACAREEDLELLDSKVNVFAGNKLSGPSAVLLGLARELDIAAYCIVVEYAPQEAFAGGAAMNSVMRTFSRITHVDLRRGQLSEQAIRTHQHLKSMSKKRNEENRAKKAGADYVWKDVAYDERDAEGNSGSSCVEHDMRAAENLTWIEELFSQIGDGTNRIDRERAIYLKSELDRLGLYEQFEGRFLGLFKSN